MIQYLGLWILLALTLNMWALLSVLRSDAGLMARAVWTLALLCLPGIAFIAWYLIGPRQRTAG